MPYTVRPIRVNELSRWAEMQRELWPDMTDADHAGVAALLRRTPPRYQVFLAFADEQPAGFIEVNLREYAEGCDTSPVGFAEGWYVRPQFRSQGVGRQLMLAAEQWARERGCTEMASDTELSNVVSQAVHARLGYQEVERLVCFYKRLDGRP